MVHDEPLTRAGLGMVLAAAPEVSVTESCPAGAAGTLGESGTDVIVLDLSQTATVDEMQRLRRAAPVWFPPVLALTADSGLIRIQQALRSGIAGLLLKHRGTGELVAAVRSLASGQGWLDPEIVPLILREFTRMPMAGRGRELDRLTKREREVLALIASGLSNAEIADRLVVTCGTVKTHVNRVFTKLEIRDRVQATVLAYRVGLVGHHQDHQ